MKVLIISGAGLLAGSHLYGQLVQRLASHPQLEKDSDYPEIILHNYPFQSIDEQGNLNTTLARKELNKVLQTHGDVTHVLVACNTLHLLGLKQIKGLIHLPEQALLEFENVASKKKALVLCSEYSRKNDLYYHHEIIYPNSQLAHMQDMLISKNITGFHNPTHEEVSLLHSVIESEGITHLIIGCTELSMIKWQRLVSIPVIDSVEVALNKLMNDIS